MLNKFLVMQLSRNRAGVVVLCCFIDANIAQGKIRTVYSHGDQFVDTLPLGNSLIYDQLVNFVFTSDLLMCTCDIFV